MVERKESAAGDAAMRVAGPAPLDVLSRAQAGLRQGTRTDGADRPLSPEASVLRQPPHPRLAGRSGAPDPSQEGPAPDAHDGPGGAVSKAQPQTRLPGPQASIP